MSLLQNIPWLVLLVVLPLAGSMLCFLFPQRVKLLGLMTALLIPASVLAMAYQVVTQGVLHYAVGGWGAPLGINLYVDGDRKSVV